MFSLAQRVSSLPPRSHFSSMNGGVTLPTVSFAMLMHLVKSPEVELLCTPATLPQSRPVPYDTVLSTSLHVPWTR